jgi:DNA (cytosine-5)-methyltransferase 1
MAIFKRPADPMRELALFAGAGGGILGGQLLGWRTVCAVEFDAYAASVLVARQNDKTLEPFPIWDDVRTFDGRPWRGVVDVISGGFPCQDISAAGKGAGITGERSGLWSHMARIVGEVLPKYVYVENSPMLVGRGLARVVGDLAALGYDCKWGVLGADDVGAPHERKRLWLISYANSVRQLQPQGTEQDEWRRAGNCGQANDLPNTDMSHGQRGRLPKRSPAQSTELDAHCAPWGSDPADDAESGVGRMANGVAYRVDRLKAIGNGQVPLVAATAWEIIRECQA